jgi:hypothetical protein
MMERRDCIGGLIYLDVRMHSMLGMDVSSLSRHLSDIIVCILLSLILGLVVKDTEAQKALFGNVGSGHLC